jgi:hypothetical protein
VSASKRRSLPVLALFSSTALPASPSLSLKLREAKGPVLTPPILVRKAWVTERCLLIAGEVINFIV